MYIANYVIHICVRDIAGREIKEKEMLRERNRRKESH